MGLLGKPTIFRKPPKSEQKPQPIMTAWGSDEHPAFAMLSGDEHPSASLMDENGTWEAGFILVVPYGLHGFLDEAQNESNLSRVGSSMFLVKCHVH